MLNTRAGSLDRLEQWIIEEPLPFEDPTELQPLVSMMRRKPTRSADDGLGLRALVELPDAYARSCWHRLQAA
jgi:hypothetical protein